jgi:hypothetical protein
MKFGACCQNWIDEAAKRFLLDGIRTKERGRHADLASRHDIWSTGDAVLTEAALAFDCMDRMPPPGRRQDGKIPKGYPAESRAIISLALRKSEVSSPSLNFPYAEAST